MTQTAPAPGKSFLDEVEDAVAPQVAAEQAVTLLKQLPGEPLDARAVADEATARKQILNRDIDGALVIDHPAGTTDTLLVASGGGTVLATALETLTATLKTAERRTVKTVDVAPASAQDFDGLSSFYLVVGRCVGGYLAASILAISSGARPANPKRAVIRLVVMALIAIVGGLGGAVIIGPVLGALPGSVCALWGPRCPGRLRGRRGHPRPPRGLRDRPAHRDRGQPERGRRLPAAHAAALLEGDRAGPAAGRGHLGRPLDRVLQGQ